MAAIWLAAGCATTKPAPSGSAQTRKQTEPTDKKSATAQASKGKTATTAKAKPAQPEPQPRAVFKEAEPVAPRAPSKPVAVELPPSTPAPQPEAQPQPDTRKPVDVERPRTMTPRPPMRLREPIPASPQPQQQAQASPPAQTPSVQPSQPRRRPPTAADANIPAAPAKAAPSAAVATPAGDMVAVNFEQVDIRTVLKSIGEITSTNFIPSAGVAGPVTVMSPTPIRLSQVYGFLQSVLDVYGYATVETDNAIKVVPKAEAVKRNLEVHIGADPAFIPKTDALITQILPLKHADAAEVSQILEPFLASSPQNATCPRINSILITDTSSNIHYIAEIVQQVDVEGSGEKLQTFPLAHASAQVLSDQINRILDKSPSPLAPAAGNRPRITTTLGKSAKIIADDRTNTLIVVGTDPDIEAVRGLVAKLDVERPIGLDTVHVSYLKNADANDVARALEAALAGMKMVGVVDSKQTIQVHPEPSTNALIIVASPQDFEVISKIVDRLDIVREQVEVEMLILEVTEEALRQIGVDWATMDQAVSNSVRGFGLTNLGPRASYQNGTLEGLALGAWKGDASNPSIGAILQALQTTTGVNILSTSSIVTSNHHQANMIAGESRPFVTGTRITETTDPANPTLIKQYDYRDVGVTMKITPHVSQGGIIRLDIDGEITKLLETAVSASIDTPVTAKRHAQTTVTMKSDATVVIGGLTRDDTTRIEKKVPLLGDLPLLGFLFRSREEQLQKTNLLIFITPHVIASQEDWVDVSNKKREEMPPAHQWDN
jgi:general secretion pathway protein D